MGAAPDVGNARSGTERMAPTQALESGEIAVCRDPFAARIDGEGRQVRVSDQVPLRARVETEAGE